LRRRFGVVLAIGGIAAIILMSNGCNNTERSRIAETQRDVAEARTEIELCDSSISSLPNTLAMGAAHLPEYVGTGNYGEARRVVSDVIEPLLSTRELACQTAQTAIEMLGKDAPIGNRVKEHISKLARIRDAFDRLRASVVADPPVQDLVLQRLSELVDASH
jgi:hypothetical protein